MLARFSAGASFDPSPVTATTSPRSSSAATTPHLVLWLRAGEQQLLALQRDAGEPLVTHRVEIRAVDDAHGAVADDADSPGDGLRGETVVTGDHIDADACPAARGDGIHHLGPGRVRHGHQPEQRPARARLRRLMGDRSRGPAWLPRARETVGCHRIVGAGYLLAQRLVQRHVLPEPPDGGAAFQHGLR